MDSLQPWWGNYFSLDEVYEFLKSVDRATYGHKNVHEIFITWVVAKFFQYQKKSEHMIGFPSLRRTAKATLINLLEGGTILEDDNFDTVIVDTANVNVPIRLQIKRYMEEKSPNTESFFNFLCSKVNRYGKAPELNVVFHNCVAMKFNFPRLAELLKGVEFQVGSITVFTETPLPQKCFLFSVHPRFTGELFSPEMSETEE